MVIWFFIFILYFLLKQCFFVQVWTKVAFQCRTCAMICHKKCLRNCMDYTHCAQWVTVVKYFNKKQDLSVSLLNRAFQYEFERKILKVLGQVTLYLKVNLMIGNRLFYSWMKSILPMSVVTLKTRLQTANYNEWNILCHPNSEFGLKRGIMSLFICWSQYWLLIFAGSFLDKLYNNPYLTLSPFHTEKETGRKYSYAQFYVLGLFWYVGG